MAEIRRDDILDPQLAVGFEELTKVMGKTADEIDILIQKGIELSKVQKDIASSQKSVATASEQVNKNAKETEAQTTKLNAIFQQTYNVNKELEKQRTKEYADKQKAAKQTADNLNLINSEAKSLQQLTAQNKALIAERNKLDLTTEEGKKKLAEYNARIEQNSKLIIGNGTAQEKQRANVGNYRNSLEGLLVSFKQGEIGIKALGKQFMVLTAQLLANPIVLIIAAIVGAFALLYNAIKRTDSGGTELEARFEQLKAIFDVVLDRVFKFASGIANIFKGNFKQAAEDFGGAVKGAGEQMNEAAKAAYQYIYAMDALKDAEVGYTSQRAINENKIAKLEALSVDKTKSTEARKAALVEAIKIGEEQLKKEKYFADEAYRIELEKLAKSKGISVKALNDFIAADDQKQNVLLANNKKLAEIRNSINDEGQQKLEDLYKASIELDTKFFEENKRNLSKLSGFENEIIADRKAAEEKEAEERKKRSDEYKKKKEDEAKFISDIERAKIDNMADGTVKDLALINFEFEQKKAGYVKDVQNAKLRNQLIEQAEIEHQNKISEVLYDEEENRVEAEKKLLKEKKDLTDKLTEEELNTQVAAYNARLTALKKSYAAGEITEEQYSAAVIKASEDNLQAQIDNLKILSEQTIFEGEAKEELLLKIADLEKELQNESLDNLIEINEKKLEEEEKANELRKKGDEELYEKKKELANEAFSFIGTLFDRQLTMLDIEKANELALVGDNEDAKAAIEKKYAEESLAIKRKQAIVDKAQALFNIGLSTAEGIVKALASTNIPLSITIGVIGALQAAAVLATPLPQFDKGVEHAPAGGFIAGEKRPEIMKHKGKYSLVSQPTIFGDSFAGAKIIGGAETDRIIKDGLLSGLSLSNIQAGKSDEAVQLSAILSELQSSKEKVDIHFDSRGIQTIYHKQRFKNLRIDKYIS